MSGTFPTSPAPDSFKLSSITPTRISQSHSMRRSVRSIGAQRWALTLNWPPMTRAQFAPIFAFAVAQRGQFGTFTTLLAGNKTPQGSAGGTPVVAGAAQVGRAIATSGWPVSATVLKAGDIIKFADVKVYMLTADAVSNGSGLATLSIEPALMVSPANLEAIVTSNVPFQVAFTGDISEAQGAAPGFYSYSADLVEAI